MIRTTCPSLPMRMNALGTKGAPAELAGVVDAAIEGWVAKPINKPPPSAALALRNWRREVMSALLLAVAGTVRRALDSLADSQIRAAAADVPGHGGVDVAIGRLGICGEQRRRGHDLVRVAINAMRS